MKKLITKYIAILLILGGMFNMAAVDKAIKNPSNTREALLQRMQKYSNSLEAQTNAGTATSEEMAAAQAKAAKVRKAMEKLSGVKNETTNTLPEDKQSQ